MSKFNMIARTVNVLSVVVLMALAFVIIFGGVVSKHVVLGTTIVFFLSTLLIFF